MVRGGRGDQEVGRVVDDDDAAASCFNFTLTPPLSSEWSVLYVTIASFMLVVSMATVVWLIVCCCSR